MMKVVVVLLCALTAAKCANILGLFSHAGKSHHILGEILFKTLAKRGHNVTMVSPFPLKNKVENYTDIDNFETRDDMKERIANGFFEKISTKSFLYHIRARMEMTLAHTELLFVNAELTRLIKSGTKFDLVIMDYFYNDAQIVYGLIFDCPVILSASSGFSMNTNVVVGNPTHWAFTPAKNVGFTANMNFLERVENVWNHLILSYEIYALRPKHQAIVDKYVNNAPKIEQLFENVALVLSNAHFSYQSVKPTVPNIVDVGGYHIEDAKPIMGEIGRFLDGANEGAVYFSLGSNMRSAELGAAKIRAILDAFSKLPYKILWKFEDDNLASIPANVKISKWFPQIDILAHPNTKLFISHGGVLSVTEAVFFGVPMIGIPMFGDQHSNVAHLVQLGYARYVARKDISEKTLIENINAIFNNTSYAKKAKLHSELLRTQQVPPMEKAIYWIEHVIKYKGADYLKNGSMKYSWYQNLLLDVIAALFAILLLIIYAIRCIIKLAFKSASKSVECSKKKKKDISKTD